LSPSIQTALENLRVLVVDDSRTLRKVLIRELTGLGILNFTEAENGVECIEKLRDAQFDLVLLDMEMPELDGLGTLEAIKSSPELRDLSVIVIAGSDQVEKVVRCIEMGAEDYLSKPFNATLLAARIRSCAEKQSLKNIERSYLSQLEHEKKQLQLEQMKSDKLMLNILPRPIADRLKREEINISGDYPNVTVLFSDLVGFTQMASSTTAAELVTLLNDLFTRFDKRAEALGLEKIKTIGDAYMAVGGLPIPRSDHAEIAAHMALGMFEDLEKFNDTNGMSLEMRVGLNSGPVIAGVIGYTKFSYDLWGNTVNVASRMESSGTKGRVMISPSTYELVNGSFTTTPNTEVECKGIGKVMTYFLEA
jgi:adenylate cyclase